MSPDSPSLASLTDLPTLERLLKAGGVDALMAALDDGLARTPAEARVSTAGGPIVGPRTLRFLRSAVALDADFLREHPEALFQCLYNRLRWFDAPDVASHYPPEARGAWTHPEAHLFQLAKLWRGQRDAAGGGPWLESLLPLRGELDSTDQVLPHGAIVLCANFSPSGTMLATGSWEDERNVSVWDLATGQRLRVMAGHEAEVRSVAWSPDSTRLASGSRDHEARIWDVRTGALLHALTRQEGQVTSVAFSPDGRWLAAANLGWVVRLVDVESGQEVRTLEGHQQSVLCVAFHPSGRWLASGASDNTVRVWDTETGTVVAVLPSQMPVESIAFSPDGRWLAMSTDNGIARAETRDWKLTPGSSGHVVYSSVAWLDDTRLGALTFNRVEVLDARTGEVLLTRPYPHNWRQRSVAFHPNGRRYALTASDGRVRVNDLDAEVPPTLLAEGDGVLALWGPSEGSMAIARRLQSSLAIDAQGHARAFPNDPAEAGHHPWGVSPGGERAAYSIRRSGESPLHAGVQVMDLRTLAPERVLAAPPGPPEGPDVLLSEQPIAFSPDGQLLAGPVEPDTVRLWRATDGALLHAFHGPGGTADVVAFTPDGAHLVTCYPEDSRLQVHDVMSGERIVDTEALMDPQPSWATAERAPRLAVGQASGAVELFDLTGGSSSVIETSEEPVGLGLSADGTLLAVCGMDRVVRLYDARTGVLLHAWPHPALAFAVALGESVAITQANDQITRFFDLETGALRGEVEGAVAPEEALRRPLWEALGDGPVAFHQRRDITPLVHFHDAMEEVVILRDGLVVARGRTEKDFLYVLKLRGQVNTSSR
ncbi:WD40 repeat domain-containing protein [Corallococcus silvisoli]|uniref:WD40 repeat domain-containing protein n=1 Tax=Corallococcus silvisoli TaxID=2697031 RepID=UPI0013785370|nr:WD40 repeat domain-containing protein [Corallococcus silvisoli]NBD08265.1 High-affnity carbon uptake protein Hat/HatR [Corallococcus silvisoli]